MWNKLHLKENYTSDILQILIEEKSIFLFYITQIFTKTVMTGKHGIYNLTTDINPYVSQQHKMKRNLN